MKILIDIGHPGHVHLFKNFAHEMIRKGHSIIFTCRDKEFEIQLLKAEGFNFVSFGKKYKTTVGKIFGLFKFDLLEIIQGIKFNPDFFLSHGSPYAAHAAAFLGKSHISLEDTGNMEQVNLYLPFTKNVLTSTAFHMDLGKKQLKYESYHELAYLHPKYFTPDEKIYHLLKINKHEQFVILRFVSWNASHDINQAGLSLGEKRKVVSLLEKKYRIFISSESELPLEFKKYQIKMPPQEIHHALAFAALFIGEGATMASECAMLGTPAIYINTITAGTIDEQVKYGLIFHFKTTENLINKINELISEPMLKQVFKNKQLKMLNDKIDLTAFFVWFIENYPKSSSIMKENPDYKYNFK